MKKLTLLYILLLTATCFFGCAIKERPLIDDQSLIKDNTSKTQAEIDPIILDVIATDNGVAFERAINQYISLEKLEKQFDFYGLYDAVNDTYDLVYKDRHTVFQLDHTKGEMIGNNAQTIPFTIENEEIKLDSKSIAKLFSIDVDSYDNLRVIRARDDLNPFKKALLSGTAYRDYSKLQAERFQEREVQIVNVAEGFALIIIDGQPYLTSELNLTMIQDELPEQPTNKIQPIVMAWDLYGNKSDQKIDSLVDVVIPKWLSLQDVNGKINDLFRPEYTANVRRQGADLWVLVNNGFDPDMTAQFLANGKARQVFIQSLIDYVKNNGVAGINLDFENMHLKDSDRYVQLAAELHVATVANNIPLSIAVTVPGGSENWSLVYDRPRLGQIAEYITLMAYDQHWENSQTSGPVAGYSWVDKNIQSVLEMVPFEKLVLGLPFYTRVWYERLSEEKANTMKVRSKSVFMDAPRKLIDDNNPVRIWDKEHSLYYFAYFDGDSIVKFWYDDAAAVARKAKLFKKYNLAGIACWSLGFETEDVWQALAEVVRGD